MDGEEIQETPTTDTELDTLEPANEGTTEPTPQGTTEPTHKLPLKFINLNCADAYECSIFGVPILALSREELVAALCYSIKQAHFDRQESGRRIDFLSGLRSDV